MLPLDWIVGFIEGEGTFSGSQRTPNYFQPNFTLYQNDRVILEKVQETLEAHGIVSRIYVNQRGCHGLQVNSIAICRELYKLIRPLMHAPYKIEQIEAWHAKLEYKGRNVKETVDG